MDFVIIANAWGAGVSNPTSKHRIALELVRRGHRVLWIEGAGMRAPSLGSGHDRLRMLRKVWAALRGVRREGVRCEVPGRRDGAAKTGAGGLWVLSPLLVPLPRYAWVRRLNGTICRIAARSWAGLLRFREPVLINYVPVLAEAMKGWGSRTCRRPKAEGRRPEAAVQPEPVQPFCPSAINHQPSTIPPVVYHCVDRWDAFKMYDARVMAEMDRRCCEYADIVIASSAELVERCRRFNDRTHLLSHGVDHGHFAAAVDIRLSGARPADLPPGPVIGFFGLLSEWIDQDLLLRLATDLSSVHLVLIGQPDVPVDRLRGLPNIHMLGPRPFADLPSYVAWFDVGLIPFEVNDLTRSVNPIKLREMLSAGCPVVSTDLPEVRCYVEPLAGAVAVATDHGEVVKQVRLRLVPLAGIEERRRISRAMLAETWEHKVGELLALLGLHGENREAPS